VIAPRLASADSHLDEPDGLLQELPADLRAQIPAVRRVGERNVLHGPGLLPVVVARHPRRELTDLEAAREFRGDPTQGCDAEVRLRRQADDGVAAEVVYPNRLLGLCANPDVAFQVAVSRVYNEFVASVVAPRRAQLAPVGLLPAGDVGRAVEEAEHCAALGIPSVTLPVSVPWQPYSSPAWVPLWTALADMRLVAAFHVFSGSLVQGADFANPFVLSASLLREGTRAAIERLTGDAAYTVALGMAAAMSPIVHLVGGGVLERHPGLRFVVVEANVGWLPWLLQTLDALQARRGSGMFALPLRASDYFRRQGFATFIDDPLVPAVVEHVGAANLLWSNDYPHDEGSYLESADVLSVTLAGLDRDVQRQLTWANTAALYELAGP
jgi:predicted TIM-barrel fold metal-dependent hydrolase